MKTLRWNLGILIINLGYKVRYYQREPNKFSMRWNVGKFILHIGYKFRGDIPQRRWKGVHI